MDKFVLTGLRGVKDITLNVFFFDTLMRLESKNKNGFVRNQYVTACVIRHNNKILGTGVTLQHPDDDRDDRAAKRSALKVAARVAGPVIWLEHLNDEEKLLADGYKIEKRIFGEWRRLKAAEDEAEK